MRRALFTSGTVLGVLSAVSGVGCTFLQYERVDADGMSTPPDDMYVWLGVIGAMVGLVLVFMSAHALYVDMGSAYVKHVADHGLGVVHA